MDVSLSQEMASLSLPRGSATFATDDLDEGARYITESSFHTLRIGSADPFVELSHWRFSLEHTDIDMVQLNCGDEFRIGKECETGHYLFQFPLAGLCHFQIGRETFMASPGEVFVINPRQTARKRWVGPCAQLMVQINRNALDQLLSSELDGDCREPLIFDRSVQDDRAGFALRAVTRSVWQSVSGHEPLQQRRIARTFERSLLMSYLGVLPHNYSNEFNRSITPAAPYYVKRAEDYIRVHLRDPIEIEDLVAVAGVSSRSLYYGFRRWRDTTPMSYLRNLRLGLAHDKLKQARADGGNVTRIALSVGYDHLSRFSKDYKQRFGVSPSATMLQTR